MEVETRGAHLHPRAMEFEDHASDGVHVQDSPRTSTCTEVTAFSDVLVERDSTASALCNHPIQVWIFKREKDRGKN